MKHPVRHPLLAGAVALLLANPLTTHAADYLWSQSGTGYWDVGANWADGNLPVTTSGNPVRIDNGGTAVVRNAGASIGSNQLHIGSGGSGHLQLTAGGTLDSRAAFIGSTTTTTGSGSLSISGAGALWTLTSAASAYFNVARYGAQVR